MSKISNSVGSNFLAKDRKLSVLPTSLDIFDIQQHYIRILSIHAVMTVIIIDLFDLVNSVYERDQDRARPQGQRLGWFSR